VHIHINFEFENDANRPSCFQPLQAVIYVISNLVVA